MGVIKVIKEAVRATSYTGQVGPYLPSMPLGQLNLEVPVFLSSITIDWDPLNVGPLNVGPLNILLLLGILKAL